MTTLDEKPLFSFQRAGAFLFAKRKGRIMEEEEIIVTDIEDMQDDVEQPILPEKKPVPEAKLKKLRNLKYFREWTDEQIQEWYRLRHGDDEAPPPEPPDLSAVIPTSDTTTEAKISFNVEEYKKKYNLYLGRYRKEYAVDMNETNDAEALKQLVRYVIQQERADEIIMEEQSSNSPDHRTLKGLGDFQRSLQMNINELQEKLGITRKLRKEKSHDDIPQYIKSLQDKAKEFWERKTVAITCDQCHIELARYWLNFPDKVHSINFEITCDKCGEKVSYVA